MYFVLTPMSEVPMQIATIKEVRTAAYNYFKDSAKGIWIIEGHGETILAFSKEGRVFVGDYEVINERGTIKKSS